MDANPSSDEATLEAIADLVKRHIGGRVYSAFHLWCWKLSRRRRLAFLKDIGRFDIETSIPFDDARQPDDTLKRKAEQALAYTAVALWHIYELRTATQHDDRAG